MVLPFRWTCTCRGQDRATYGWKGHSKSDQEPHRTKEEIEAWKEKQRTKRFRKMLISEGLIGEEEAEQIEEEARQTIVEAVEFAQATPEPAADTMLEGVYA